MIPISIPHLYDEDKVLLKKAIDENFIAHGEQISMFETQFAKFCNRKYAVTCSNGTVALYLAVKALNLPKGSEVILPSMTIVSCLTAVLENDLVPVFCDINNKTWNVDFDTISSKITNNTSAVIIVNTYGLMVDPTDIIKLNERYPNIKVIEDASESHGASFNQIKAGSLGDISTFSFYANKIITMGEGGCILTDSEDMYTKLLSLRNLNFIDRKKYLHSEAGFNFRITNMQACIGLGQLHNVDITISNRKRVASIYNANFKNNIKIQIPYNAELIDNVYWYYGIIVKENYDEVLHSLIRNDIDYRHFFSPLHKQPFINKTDTLPNSEYAYNHGILLPIYTTLENDKVHFISNVILEAL